MKTKPTKQTSALQSRPEQLSTDATGREQQPNTTASAVPLADAREPLPRLDFAKRHANRQLPTEAVVSLLRTTAPEFFALAEVVGQWVWIQFTEKQPRDITRQLAQLGFHWNNHRQAWQHPCGQFRRQPADYDPRQRYGSHSPADTHAA